MNQLSLAGTPLDYFHICAFFNSSDEEYDILCPFYQEGLDQGEKICTSSTLRCWTNTARACWLPASMHMAARLAASSRFFPGTRPT